MLAADVEKETLSFSDLYSGNPFSIKLNRVLVARSSCPIMARFNFIRIVAELLHGFFTFLALNLCSSVKFQVIQLSWKSFLNISILSPGFQSYTGHESVYQSDDEGQHEPHRSSYASRLSRSSKLDPERSPCAKVIDAAERANARNGHENLGFLSYESGFLPTQSPLTAFPAMYSAWDNLAKGMPELIKTQTLQLAVKNLPVLPADPEHLPDIYLHRAATFLCIAAHAYIRLDGDAPLQLVGAGGERVAHDIPASIETPWTEVSNRLGREAPFMSYIDLIVYNWQWNTPKYDSTNVDFVVENLSLLVPTVDNQEENVFYLTQTELLAHATPLLRDIAQAQSAVQQNEVIPLKAALREMISTVNHLSRTTLAKVTPRPSARTFTDPVVWTKSVASLAIPIRKDVQGPTGTGSPFFHMMDEFISRSEYNGHLGKESLELRRNYPPHWRALLEAVGQVSVESFVNHVGDDECRELWTTLQETYKGHFGLLGLHRRKVFAYLSTAFRIGRSSTIGGFKGKPSDEPWVKVHKELEKSRQERTNSSKTQVKTLESEASNIPSVRSCKKQVKVSEVLTHTTQSSGYWFSAHGKVYDATPYHKIHPGGDKIIVYSSGRDVTHDLDVVQHFSNPSIRSKLDKYVIGDLAHFQFPHDSSLQKTYDYTVALGYKVADFQGTWTNDMSFLQSKITRVDPEGQMTSQKARYFQRACRSLRSVYAPGLTLHLGAVVDVLKSRPKQSSFPTLRELPARLEEIYAQQTTCTTFEAEVSSLGMTEACRMADFVSAMFREGLEIIASALHVLESQPHDSEIEILISETAFLEKLHKLTNLLEDLGSEDKM